MESAWPNPDPQIAICGKVLEEEANNAEVERGRIMSDETEPEDRWEPIRRCICCGVVTPIEELDIMGLCLNCTDSDEDEEEE